MNTFVSNFNDMANRTVTENGCETLKSSLNANVDMFGMMSSMRNKQENDIISLFVNAFTEDKNISIRNLFYLRDIRGGQGERNIFRICCAYLIKNKCMTNEQFNKFISYVPEFGRWDDLFFMLNVAYQEKNDDYVHCCLDFIKEQLITDINNLETNENISLLAKWFPLANNTANKQKKFFAKMLANTFFANEKECRKVIVNLRKHLNIVEQKMSANEWENIDYSIVPSKAGMKYTNAFRKHDNERYESFLSDVVTNDAKINTGTLYPYELVHKASSSNDEAFNVMWDNLPDYTNGNSAICVVDVSGSMETFDYYNNYSANSTFSPLDVALSLGLYFGERNNSEFKNKFFTFSENPECVVIPENKSLFEKLRFMVNSSWGMNTNIQALFELYLHLAENSKVEDLPKTLIIISDMEFDQIYYDNPVTAMEFVKKEFAEKNIPVPTLCFWNVNASGHNVPVKYDECGAVLVSGSSPVIFKMVMEGKTPIDFMLDTLNQERYNITIF